LVIILGALGVILYLVLEPAYGAWTLFKSDTILFAVVFAAEVAASIIGRWMGARRETR
jgi:CDP-diglyceride synthetase